jgi:hypothetical protein
MASVDLKVVERQTPLVEPKRVLVELIRETTALAAR